MPFYITVTINDESVTVPPDISPLGLTLEAIARVAALGNAMHVPTGMPKIAQEIVGELALLFWPWVQKPSANANANLSTLAAAPTLATPMSGNHALLSKLYPQLSAWLAVYQQFNALGRSTIASRSAWASP